MTESEKAKAYDEAVEKAKSAIKNCGDNKGRIAMIESIFPVLYQSEDEKIRKALIRFHKSTIDIDGIKGADILAWLEKQGNNTPTIIWHNIDEKPEEMKELFCEWESDDATWHDVAFYDEESHTFRHAKMPINVTKWVYVDELLEKQGEQKPVIDFNAKDWYVSKVDGKIHNIYYSVDKVEPKFKVRYAGGEYNVLEVKDIAGVTFYGIEDEPNHIDYVKAENCEIISGYAIKENGSPYPTKSAVFSEKKPTEWSKEDENRFQNIIACIEDCYNEKDAQDLIRWLKSFKNRVQPKQEWSDKDEEMTEELIKGCVSAEKAHHFLCTPKEVSDWLKSIKDRMKGKEE